MGQFNLQLAFTRVGMQGKNIKYQSSTVNDFYFLTKSFFQFALLARQEFIIKNDHTGVQFIEKYFHLLNFTGADISGGVGMVKTLDRLSSYYDTGRFGQPRQFFQTIFYRE